MRKQDADLIDAIIKDYEANHSVVIPKKKLATLFFRVVPKFYTPDEFSRRLGAGDNPYVSVKEICEQVPSVPSSINIYIKELKIERVKIYRHRASQQGLVITTTTGVAASNIDAIRQMAEAGKNHQRRWKKGAPSLVAQATDNTVVSPVVTLSADERVDRHLAALKNAGLLGVPQSKRDPKWAWGNVK